MHIVLSHSPRLAHRSISLLEVSVLINPLVVVVGGEHDALAPKKGDDAAGSGDGEPGCWIN